MYHQLCLHTCTYLDSLSNLGFVPVGRGGIDMSVPLFQRNFHSLFDLPWLGLPGAEPDHGHLRAGIESDVFVSRHRLSGES